MYTENHYLRILCFKNKYNTYLEQTIVDTDNKYQLPLPLKFDKITFFLIKFYEIKMPLKIGLLRLLIRQ